MTSHPTPARWVTALKGNGRVLLDPAGFRMKIKKKYEGKTGFVCTEREKLGCKVLLVMRNEDEMILSIRNEHNHDNDLMKNEVLDMVSKKVEVAVENNISPRSVLSDISNKLLSDPSTSAGLPYLPKQTNLARMINLKKSQKMEAPKVPRN